MRYRKLKFCPEVREALETLRGGIAQIVAKCPVIQVEEPRHHGLTTRPDCSDAELEFTSVDPSSPE